MTILCKKNIQERSSNIKITVFTDTPDEVEKEKKKSSDSIITSNARELNKRLALWSKEFDEILLNYKRAEMRFNSKYSTGGSINGSKTPSVNSELFIGGYSKILDVTDYHPSDVELTLPEEGVLIVKGTKIGMEFEETLDIPGNIDDEEIVVEVTLQGKLQIKAPLLT